MTPAPLSEAAIAALVAPYLNEGEHPTSETGVPANLYRGLSDYLALLLHWNARTNLTAIREPEEIVRRHFGESLFTARHLTALLPVSANLLDFGSGAGLPGIPIQLYRPTFSVTLAESQGKKAAFLRETVRSLELPTKVWSQRVEAMPKEQTFDCVTLRAVDRMQTAIAAAEERVAEGGLLAVLASEKCASRLTPFGVHLLPATRNSHLFLFSQMTGLRKRLRAIWIH